MSGRSPSSPRLLGRYSLHDRIAAGGMATVHLGRLLGPEGFARTVAIKRMRPHVAEDAAFVSMFLDEGRLVARIRHPNVLATLDIVATDGELFIVMEYIHGESFAHLLRAARTAGTPIPPGIVASIMAGVLHGLHAAHEAKNERGEPLGIVHRDVSPENILVGVDGTPRVLDFGVAKASGRVQTTQNGQLKGKLSYMAPEQLHGRVARTTDVYAASIVLWEALAGRRLVEGDNEAQILDRVLKGCTTPPSTYAPDVPAALDAVTMRGLSLDPANRFQTARDMALALEEALPLVASSKIGQWVEVTARGTLEERGKRIAAIEAESQRPDFIPEPSIDVPDEPSGAEHHEHSVFTQLSAAKSATTKVSVPQPRRPPPRRPWLLVSAAALVLMVSAAIVAGRRSSPPATAASPPAADTKAAAAQNANVEPKTPTEAPPLADAAAPSIPVSALPRVPEKPPTSATVPATPVAPTRRHNSNNNGSAAHVSQCDPPWYYDARGLRIFREECL